MCERRATEVWVEAFRAHAYIRLGEKANLATVNDPRMAECVREALQKYVDASVPCAKGNDK